MEANPVDVVHSRYQFLQALASLLQLQPPISSSSASFAHHVRSYVSSSSPLYTRYPRTRTIWSWTKWSIFKNCCKGQPWGHTPKLQGATPGSHAQATRGNPGVARPSCKGQPGGRTPKLQGATPGSHAQAARGNPGVARPSCEGQPRGRTPKLQGATPGVARPSCKGQP